MSSHANIQGTALGIEATRPDSDGIEYEVLQGVAHARQVEELQMEIWSANETWVVPSHALQIVSDYGGILLGARLDTTLVGFVLGFLARSDGMLFHASHMLGVLPAYQHHGIGAALKWQQREVARQQGLDLMRWTFDPLESRNAYLNFHKLGTRCRLYGLDYYGPMEDALNRDLPSDRLLVEWNLHDSRRGQESPGGAQTILHNAEGTPELRIDEIVPGLPVAIEIPRDVQAMKREAPDSALAWRLAVRQAFSVAFDAGYTACNFRDGAYILLPVEALANEN